MPTESHQAAAHIIDGYAETKLLFLMIGVKKFVDNIVSNLT